RCSLPPPLSPTPPSPPYTSSLSLHDALPIFRLPARRGPGCSHRLPRGYAAPQRHRRPPRWGPCDPPMGSGPVAAAGRQRAVASRSEEHTSELQSRFDLVCRLLLEKKKYQEVI